MKHRMGFCALAALLSCGDEATVVIPSVRPPVVERCSESVPRTFEVYFILNVSGSMETFLTAMRDQLEAFALGFPDVDVNGDRLLVDYYVIGFVNDHAFFPEGAARMTSSIAVAQAIQDAIDAATGDRNFDGSNNSERSENMLDAVDAALDNISNADRKLFLIASLDPFANQGERLLPNFTVQNAYADVRDRLQSSRADSFVYAFTNGDLEGFDRSYRGQAAIQADGLFDLGVLLGDTSGVGSILNQIAEEVACGDPDRGGSS
ncbi:MAG: hypothetical protein HC923_06965 [Myxococcales bacterium]|nr:hypothetical protein [Myxococcales bacterium]